MSPQNPYRIAGPALVSFSGGRTSGYMVRQIVLAHDGALPDDIVVAFANTGKERPETLRFVHEFESRWGINVRWVEWRAASPGFEQVGFNSAARRGEPFEALIKKKKRLPNWNERWCTEYLKVKPIFALMAALGHGEPGNFSEVIGMRADEGFRIFKGLERAEKVGRLVLYPLARAGVVRPDVMAFWRAQEFDLELEPHEGNCDVCFLKGKGIRKRIIRDHPGCEAWWSRQEVEQGGSFSARDLVSELADEVRREPEFWEGRAEEQEYDVECGLHCGAEA